MSSYKLAEHAVLMRLSISTPGEQRQDHALTSEVTTDKHLGERAGKWVKNLYPKEALEKLTKLDNEARAFHKAVTLPYDQGIGILPGELIMHYSDRMREFALKREVLRDEFLGKAGEWVAWGVQAHNGTFEPDNYPGCQKGADGGWVVDGEEFKRQMSAKFAFEAVPLPVPDGSHFSQAMHSLLGVSAEKVDMRVRDAVEEAERELMRRLLAPVSAMAKRLGSQPAGDRKDIVFRDTLVGNLKEIAQIAPALNMSKDPKVAEFIKEVEALGQYTPETLRDDKAVRAQAAAKAEELAKRMAAYKL